MDGDTVGFAIFLVLLAAIGVDAIKKRRAAPRYRLDLRPREESPRVSPAPPPGPPRSPLQCETVSELTAFVSAVTGLAGTVTGNAVGSRPDLKTVVFEGPLPSGRGAKVSFYDDTGDGATNTYVRLAVSAEAAPDLRVTFETVAARINKRLGLQKEIEIGDEAFDNRYLLETQTPDLARKALTRSPEIKSAIEAAFGKGAVRVSFGGGIASAVFGAGTLMVDSYKGILEALDAAAHTFDRVSLTVKALGGERRAALDSAGKTRCPYCRSGIAGDEETLVACESCKTVLHEGCWEEHGRCPILGCTGREPERRRTR